MPFKAQNRENSPLVKLLTLSDIITCELQGVVYKLCNIRYISGTDGDDTTWSSMYSL